MAGLVRTAVQLEAGQIERVDALRSAGMRSRSAVIRQLIEEALAARGLRPDAATDSA